MKKYDPVISNPIPNEEGRVPITHALLWGEAINICNRFQPRQMETIHIERSKTRRGYDIFFKLDKGHTTYRHLRMKE